MNFTEAAAQGNLSELIKILSSTTIDVETLLKALHEATKGGHLEVVKHLLQQKILHEKSLQDTILQEGTTGLGRDILDILVSATLNNSTLLESLLELKLFQTFLKEYFSNVLCGALIDGNLTQIERLLKNRSSDLSEWECDSIIYQAVYNNKTEILNRLLLEKEIHERYSGKKPIGTKQIYSSLLTKVALEKKNTAIFARLWEEKGVRESDRDSIFELLQWATSFGLMEVVELLLKEEDIQKKVKTESEYGLFLLKYASQSGNLLLVERLLQEKMIKQFAAEKNNWPLCAAALYGHVDIFERLLKEKSIFEAFYKNPHLVLRYAAQAGHPQMIKRLLEEAHVQKIAHANNNEVLCLAVASGQFGFPMYYNLPWQNENFLTYKYTTGYSEENDYEPSIKYLVKIDSVSKTLHENGTTILWSAAHAREGKKIMHFLLENRLRDFVSKEKNKVLKRAIESSNLSLVIRLLQEKAVQEELMLSGIELFNEIGQNIRVEEEMLYLLIKTFETLGIHINKNNKIKIKTNEYLRTSEISIREFMEDHQPIVDYTECLESFFPSQIAKLIAEYQVDNYKIQNHFALRQTGILNMFNRLPQNLPVNQLLTKIKLIKTLSVESTKEAKEKIENTVMELKKLKEENQFSLKTIMPSAKPLVAELAIIFGSHQSELNSQQRVLSNELLNLFREKVTEIPRIDR